MKRELDYFVRWGAPFALALIASMALTHELHAPWWAYLLLELAIVPFSIFLALRAPSRKDQAE